MAFGKTLHLSAVVEIAFANENAFRLIGECIHKCVRMSGNDELHRLRSLDERFSHQLESIWMETREG